MSAPSLHRESTDSLIYHIAICHFSIGDYGETDCELWSPGNYLTIQLSTDGFTESIGFTANYSALPSTTEQEEEKSKKLLKN